MPKLTINGVDREVESGQRLVRAIMEAGVSIGHRCGGAGDCTTCRVRFLEGEPDVMTEAEFNLLAEAHLLDDQRLSCQIEVDRDMSIEVVETVQKHPEWRGDPGPEPSELVEPEAVWYPIEEIKKWD